MDPAAAGTEIGDVIHAEHRRILRLFGAIDDVARREVAGLGRSALRQVWVRLADLLEQHTDAEEQICFPALFGGGAEAMTLMEAAIAEHNDIREVLAEARLLEPGSARWWRTVAAAHDECSEHFRREERDVVSVLCGVLSHEESRRAARQWETFPVGHGQRASSAAIFAPVRVRTSATVVPSPRPNPSR